MFCSTCGAEVLAGLNYCNRCGNELGGASKQSPTEIESFVWAIVGITVGGIGVIIGLMAVMKNVIGFNNDVIMLVTFMSFFLVAIANTAFIVLLLKRNGVFRNKKENNDRLKEAATQKLVGMPAAQQLTDAMPPSIVEDTTRNLEPVMRKKG